MLTSVDVFSTQALASSEPAEPLQTWPGHYPDLVLQWLPLVPAPSNKINKSWQPLQLRLPLGSTSFWTLSQPGLCCLQEILPNLYLGRQASHFLLQGMGLPVESLRSLGTHEGRLRLTHVWPRATP